VNAGCDTAHAFVAGGVPADSFCLVYRRGGGLVFWTYFGLVFPPT
jgi:hypothetical protein